jgi:hypothetical protein
MFGWYCENTLTADGGDKMYISEFACGILATIGVEILLLIGYAIVRKKK